MENAAPNGSGAVLLGGEQFRYTRQLKMLQELDERAKLRALKLMRLGLHPDKASRLVIVRSGETV